MKGSVSVFERYSPSSGPGPLRTFIDSFRARKSRFSTAVAASVAAHIALGLALILVSFNAVEKSVENDVAPLRRAVEEFEAAGPADPEMEAFLAEAARTGFLDELRKLKIAGAGFADGAKAEVYKAILKASLAARGKSLTELLRENPRLVLGDGSMAFVSVAAEDSPGATVGYLARKDMEAMGEAVRIDGMRETEKGYLADGQLVRVRTPSGNEIVPADYFFRSCPYEQILSWGADLFFFASNFPLDVGGASVSPPGAADEAGRRPGPDRNSDAGASFGSTAEPGLIRVLLIRPAAMSRASPPRGGADASGAEAKTGRPSGPPDYGLILDKLMSLPESEQVTVFIRDYLEGADPDAPETAALARAFFESNLNTIIFGLTDLAAAFDCLEELYYNKALAFRIAGLWDRLRETRTGTECLLYFASQYDFERRALERLMTAQVEAEAFLDGRSTRAEVFEKARKCRVVRDVGRKVLAEIKRRGYGAPEDLLNAYRREQERIYEYLIARDGEDRDRGLFAFGCHDWDQKRYDLALERWMDIDPSYDNRTFVKIRGILSGADIPDVKMMRINNALIREDQRGADEFLLRLVRFGKWKLRGG